MTWSGNFMVETVETLPDGSTRITATASTARTRQLDNADGSTTEIPALSANTEGDIREIKLLILSADNPGLSIGDELWASGHYQAVTPPASSAPVGTDEGSTAAEPAPAAPADADPTSAPSTDGSPAPVDDGGDAGDLPVPDQPADAPVNDSEVNATDPMLPPDPAAGDAADSPSTDGAVTTPSTVTTSWPADDPANAPETPAAPSA